MMKRSYLIPVAVAGALTLGYFCLEASDSVQRLRQTLITPVICGVFLLHKVFHVRLGEPGIFFQSLDTDAGVNGPMLLRTAVFAIFALMVCAPWSLWLHTHNRKHMVLALAILTVYLLSSFGFMGFIGLAMHGLGK